MSKTSPGLPLWTGPLPEEPAHGLALRLAAVNGLTSATSAYKALDLWPNGLRKGRGVETLAAAVRRPPELLAADSFHVEPGERTARVRGVEIDLGRDVHRKQRRVCPACLRESAHHRFWWDIKAMSSCPRHRLLLEDRCNCAGRGSLSWSDGRVWRCRRCEKIPDEAGDLRRAPGTDAGDDIAAMDAYIAGRFDVVVSRSIPALDRYDLRMLSVVLERIGVFHRTGWSETWKEACDIAGPSTATDRATAFRMVVDGRLREALDAAFRAFEPERGHNPTLGTAYGWFFKWYAHARGAAVSPEITDAIYAHASTRMRIDVKTMRRDVFLSLSERTMRDIRRFDQGFMLLSAAADACGQHLLKVRRIAVAYGLMRKEKITASAVMLRKADVGVIKVLMERMIDRQDVLSMLGVKWKLGEGLEASGAVEPVLRGPEHGSRRFGYLVDDVTDLLELFERHAVADECAPDCVPVLAKTIRPLLGTIVAGVRTGTIRPLRIGGIKSGLRGFAIAAVDVRSAAATPTSPAGRPDFEHWRRRIEEIRQANGGDVPPAPAAAGRAWSPWTTAKMIARRKNHPVAP